MCLSAFHICLGAHRIHWNCLTQVLWAELWYSRTASTLNYYTISLAPRLFRIVKENIQILVVQMTLHCKEIMHCMHY